MKFSEMNLESDIVRVASELGFDDATLIQERCIPAVKSGRDLIAQSETGSGKTAAFGFPIVEKIVKGRGIQCLVLAPTRELAEQVASDFSRFSRYRHLAVVSVYGGVSMGMQIGKLKHADVVVATPGRLLDHLRQRTIDLRNVKFLVLDEADKMFEMGFIDDVQSIIQQVPSERQTMLFSATIGADVKMLSSRYMKHPESVRAGAHVDKSLLKQDYYNVNPRDKFSLLLHLIKNENPSLGMIFCGTRHTTDLVAKNLQKSGMEAVAIHGGHSQNRRTAIIQDFHSGKIHILVATDVAARGLDIKGVSHIFNFDIPKSSNEYVHRIGRTARAGKSGKAISLLVDIDHDNFRRVLEDRSLNIECMPLPAFERVPFIVARREGYSRPSFRQGRGSFRSNNRRTGEGYHSQSRSRPSSENRRTGEGYHSQGRSRPSSENRRTGEGYHGNSSARRRY